MVKENAPKMVTIGKNLILIGKVRTATVDKVDTGQVVGLSNLLGAEMFLNGDGKIRAALNRCVVAKDHHFAPADATNPSHHAASRTGVIIHSVRCEKTDLKER